MQKPQYVCWQLQALFHAARWNIRTINPIYSTLAGFHNGLHNNTLLVLPAAVNGHVFESYRYESLCLGDGKLIQTSFLSACNQDRFLENIHSLYDYPKEKQIYCITLFHQFIFHPLPQTALQFRFRLFFVFIEQLWASAARLKLNQAGMKK